MILADNYYQKGNIEESVQIFIHASNMIPCRFLPLFRLFEIYKESGQYELAEKWAKEIKNKMVKIPSPTVSFIQNEANLFLSSK
jgi:O-antigen polymerase